MREGVAFGPMVIALSAFAATFGLVVVFFVIFPLLVQGLIALAVALSLGERQENEEYLRHRSEQRRA